MDLVALLITDIEHKSASLRDKCSLDLSASFVTLAFAKTNHISSIIASLK